METQTRFDLNAAVQNWRQELAAQPDLAPDVRQELETHLRDTVAELQRRGLNGEESFWLARRRVGQPKQLGEEFAKADPIKVWRERIFWTAVACLIMRLWGTVCNAWSTFYLIDTARMRFNPQLQDVLPSWMSFYLPGWICGLNYSVTVNVLVQLANLVLIVTVVFLLVRGKLKSGRIIGQFLFESRMRFVCYTLALVFFVVALDAYLWAGSSGFPSANLAGMLLFQFLTLSFPVILIAWLLPVQNWKTHKQA